MICGVEGDFGRHLRQIRNVVGLAEGEQDFSTVSLLILPSGAYFLAAISRPGDLVINGKDLGNAMLEISARTQELPTGTVLDNADGIAYAKLYAESRAGRE